MAAEARLALVCRQGMLPRAKTKCCQQPWHIGSASGLRRPWATGPSMPLDQFGAKQACSTSI